MPPVDPEDGVDTPNNNESSHVDTRDNNVDVSFNSFRIDTDLSNSSVMDLSCNDVLPTIVPIVSDISYTILDGSGYEIITKTGKATDGTQLTRVTFDSTQPNLYDPDIHENLTRAITTYDDESPPDSQTEVLLQQIRGYANQL